MLIPDVRKDPRWYKEISESIGFKTRSIACVPMKINNEIIGVVEIIDKTDGRSIGKADIKILTVFADLSAMSIGSARKFAHAKKELKTLKEVKKRVRGMVRQFPLYKDLIEELENC